MSDKITVKTTRRNTTITQSSQGKLLALRNQSRDARDEAQEAQAAAEQSLAAIDAKITVSDQPPSGGSEGDIWLQY